MTRERRLAIEMWKDIRDMISTSDGLTAIGEYKHTFCKKHGLKWGCNCWFCQYIPYCSNCPLGGCSYDSDYATVTMPYLSKDMRIAACNNIIRALGGEA